MRLLDLFCGRWGWSRAFAARGWECVGVDLARPAEIPEGCKILLFDVLHLGAGQGFVFHGNDALHWSFAPDLICASPPCEEFSVHGMKHFHPHPKYPANGIKLFEHTRRICEESGVPYVIENVRAAQQFVGNAVHHCGPFYLWGNVVPPLLPRSIKKGFQTGGGIIQRLKKIDRKALTAYRRQNDGSWSSSKSKKRKQWTAQAATIPPELSNCVAEYAERLLEGKKSLAESAPTSLR